MPLHDWACKACGQEIRNRYQPRVAAPPPLCPALAAGIQHPLRHLIYVPDKEGVFRAERPEDHRMEILWGRGYGCRPSHLSVSLTEDSGKEVQLNGLQEIRDYEEKTCKAWERGEEGARPVVFRPLSQDQSNRDVNVFGKPNLPKLRKYTRRGKPLIVAKDDYTGD